MAYSLYTQKNEQKVPGFVAVGFIVLLVAGLTMFFRRDAEPIITQQDSSIIERVDTTNIRDASVTIFWRTKKPTAGYISYTFIGKDGVSEKKLVYDERDTSMQQEKRHNHVVTIPYAQSDTEISYYVMVNGAPLGQSAGVPFIARTARPLPNPLAIAPLYGDIGRTSGQMEKDAVVIVTIGQAKPLLTQTNTDGTFLFSPCCLYSAQSNEPLYPSVDDPVRIEIIAEDGTSKILLTDLSQMSPLEETVMVDAQEQQTMVAEIEPASPEVLAASDSIIRFEPVDIIFPREAAAIPGTRPLVRGVGEPGEAVKGRFITMDRLFQTVVDGQRNWVYQPTFDFTPGNHALQVETRNALGEPVVLSRSFTILKSGEAVLGDATGSATLTPTQIPTPEVTATASPTVVTAIPTPPVTGFSVLPFTILSVVLIVIGAGFILLF
jgi:hypothetical protein